MRARRGSYRCGCSPGGSCRFMIYVASWWRVCYVGHTYYKIINKIVHIVGLVIDDKAIITQFHYTRNNMKINH